MTTLQLVIAVGIMVGLGIFLIVRRLAPAHPDLAESLAMLSPLADSRSTTAPVRGWEAVGAWGLENLPAALRPIPTKDLAILRLTPTGYLARKLAYALVGLLLPSLCSVGLWLVGFDFPWVAPVLATLTLAGIGFILPDLEVRRQAARTRRDWVRTLACFIDLVALERSCGSGTTQALDVAAGVGDSAIFGQLRETLDKAQWAGIAAWDGLQELADHLALPDLTDAADILRLSATEGAGIYRTLRAKARSLREGILAAELTQANEANEQLSLPVSILGIVFLAILIGPALLSMMGTLP